MKSNLHVFLKIIWVGASVIVALMTRSPYELCTVSLLFLIANAADTAAQVSIFKAMDLPNSNGLSYIITSFYILSVLFSSGVLVSIVWYLLIS